MATQQQDPLTQTRTRLSRGWLIKTGIFFVVLVGFGIWGFIDATVVYPARGRADAEYRLYQYLQEAQNAGLLLNAEAVSVANPREELSRLREQQQRLAQEMTEAEAQGRTRLAAEKRMMLRRHDWLAALSRVNDLDPQHTRVDAPLDRIDELQAEWNTRAAPKPLSGFDIPAQWLFVIVGFGGGLWIAFLFARVSRKTYRWEPDTRTLVLADGRRVTPDDIQELDKRKWDKFFVTLVLKDGSQVKLDLLRYTPLEAWVLEMEKHTEGYVPPEEEGAEDAPVAIDESEADAARSPGA